MSTPQYILGQPVHMPDFTLLWSGIFLGHSTLQLSIPHTNEICECGVDHLADDGMQTVHFAVFNEHGVQLSGKLLMQVPVMDTWEKYKDEALAEITRQYKQVTQTSEDLLQAVAYAAAELEMYKADGRQVN